MLANQIMIAAIDTINAYNLCGQLVAFLFYVGQIFDQPATYMPYVSIRLTGNSAN